HLIDASFSQSHALHWADLDGDGEGELITGKCFRAHNGRDPGGNEPPCLYSYILNPARLKFTRHTIDMGRVGTGRQIRTADLNDDGRLDIAVAGKSGTYILFNKGTQRELLNKTPVMKTTAVPAFELTEQWKAKIEAIAPERPLAEPKNKRLALVFNLITGYDHWCTPHMSEVAKIMGKKSGAYDVVVSDDIAHFEKANIGKFDAIVLINNCSKNPGRNLFYDKLGDMEKANELEANLIDHVAKGNGLVGFHGAILMQNQSEAFSETMGGSFHYHPRQTTVVGKVLEKDHPISSAFKGEDLVHIDEPYRFNGAYSKFNFHPLLAMELPDFTPEEQAKLFRRSENNIARYLSWIKPHGAGRVFYCSPSHNAQSFENPKLLQFMLNGIQYALGDLECDDSVLGQ
ncbi:MAG: ThuA domain-containing protein, partial [Rhizobiaceae bacterium]